MILTAIVLMASGIFLFGIGLKNVLDWYAYPVGIVGTFVFVAGLIFLLMILFPTPVCEEGKVPVRTLQYGVSYTCVDYLPPLGR